VNACCLADPLGFLHRPRQVLETDHFRYLEMARHPVGQAEATVAREAPFCWRILAPELARRLARLGLGLHAAFYLLTNVSLFGFLVAMYLHVRQHGLGQAAALAGMTLAALTPGAVRWYEYQYWMPDPLCLALVTAAFALVRSGRYRWLALVVVVAAATRESVAVVLPYLFLESWRREGPAAAFRRTAVVAVPALLVAALIRLSIAPVVPYDVLAIARDGLAFRWRHLADNQLYVLTVGSLGVLVPMLLLFPGRLPAFLRRHPEEAAVVAVAFLSLLLANNTDRLLAYALPAMIPVALRNLRALAREARLPGPALLAAVLALQAAFFALTPSHGMLGLSIYHPVNPFLVALMALSWLAARMVWRRRR
jgi:hypothetical protein